MRIEQQLLQRNTVAEAKLANKQPSTPYLKELEKHCRANVDDRHCSQARLGRVASAHAAFWKRERKFRVLPPSKVVRPQERAQPLKAESPCLRTTHLRTRSQKPLLFI